jgi:hypothetical protein
VREDCGAIVIGWLTKLVLVFAVVAVIGFDGMSIALTKVGVADDASTAAEVAATNYQSTHNVQDAYNAGVSSIDGSGTEIVPKTFRISSNGTVTLTTTRMANTLLLKYWAPTRAWAVQSDTIVEKPAP